MGSFDQTFLLLIFFEVKCPRYLRHLSFPPSFILLSTLENCEVLKRNFHSDLGEAQEHALLNPLKFLLMLEEFLHKHNEQDMTLQDHIIPNLLSKSSISL